MPKRKHRPHGHRLVRHTWEGLYWPRSQAWSPEPGRCPQGSLVPAGGQQHPKASTGPSPLPPPLVRLPGNSGLSSYRLNQRQFSLHLVQITQPRGRAAGPAPAPTRWEALLSSGVTPTAPRASSSQAPVVPPPPTGQPSGQLLAAHLQVWLHPPRASLPLCADKCTARTAVYPSTVTGPASGDSTAGPSPTSLPAWGTAFGPFPAFSAHQPQRPGHLPLPPDGGVRALDARP